MTNKIPTASTSSHDSSRVEYNHDAFGLINVYRTSSGKGRTLFGSALTHDQYISVELSRAVMVRDYNVDRYSSKDQIVRFNISEAQWARFVSSVGNGDGIPITLDRAPVATSVVEMCPGIEMENDRIRYTNDVRREFKKAISEVQKISNELQALTTATTVSKTALREVVKKLESHLQNIPANFSFLQEEFIRTMEDIVHDSKIEVETFVKNTAVRHGLTISTESINSNLLVSNDKTSV